MSFCVVNMKKTVRFNEKATKFKIPDNPQDNVTREYLSLNDVKKTPCSSATLTTVPVKKTAVTDMKEQFLQNMSNMGFYKVPIEQISSATLTAVPVIARSVKKTSCPSDTLTAVPDMKMQLLMLCSKR
jgi:hypothetical protein